MSKGITLKQAEQMHTLLRDGGWDTGHIVDGRVVVKAQTLLPLVGVSEVSLLVDELHYQVVLHAGGHVCDGYAYTTDNSVAAVVSEAIKRMREILGA
jgi:hypothetical protein